jgi:DNA-binding SARP family transcriptional activator/Flp pilus assembly protein TadD/TolB-like protein
MHALETLDRIRLTDGDGREVDRLLQQPKRLALLAYLAAPAPGTWHRRDTLLAVFWPELDAQRGRTALRNALHVLRQHTGPGVIRTRGDEDVSVDPALFATDAAEMQRDADAGRVREAFVRYRGDYLRGLYIRDAELFERWLDDERRRLVSIARKAGLSAANECDRSGDVRGAIDLVERVAELEPLDESVVRRLIDLLDDSGDHARALAVYERFSARLAQDLRAEPSAETITRVEAIRSRRYPVVEPAAPAALIVRGAAPTVTSALTSDKRTRRWPRRALAAVVLVVAAAGALLGFVAFRGRGAERAPRLVILPMNNTAADSLAYIGSAINDEVAHRLRGIGGLETVRSPYDEWPTGVRNDLPRIGREFGSNVALRTTLSAGGDSLVMFAELVDIRTKTARPVERYVFVADDIRDVSSRLAAAVAGTLFRAELPTAPHADPEHLPTSESFRLAMRGWYLQLNERGAVAEPFYWEAIKADPNNARAWAGLSSVYTIAAAGDEVEEDPVAAQRAEEAGRHATALDPREGTPLANLAVLRVAKSRRLSDGDSLLARAIALDPANPELYLIKGMIYRRARQWDKSRDAFRMARQLDPLSPGLLNDLLIVELCSGHLEEALNLARPGLDPTRPSEHQMLARILAGLGRWDEAVAELRGLDTSLTNPADPTSALTGERAYWAIREREGRTTLARIEKIAQTHKVHPVRIAMAHIAAGDIDRGMSLLEEGISRGGKVVDRLPCFPQVDRVRGTPRFNKIIAALPKWEQ